MRIYLLFFFTFLAVIIAGCNTNSKKINKSTDTINAILPHESSDNDNIKRNAYADVSANIPLSCDSLLTLLVKSSNIDADLKKFTINAQEMDKGILTINITNINEVGHSTPIAWLELDTAKYQLRDITINPDSPKILLFDTTLYTKLLKQCLR